MGGAPEAGGVRLHMVGVAVRRPSLAPWLTNDDRDFAVSGEFLIAIIACKQSIGLCPEDGSFFGVRDARAIRAASVPRAP